MASLILLMAGSTFSLIPAIAAAQSSGIEHQCLSWYKRSIPPCFPKDVPVRKDFTVSVSEGDPRRGAYLIQGRTQAGMQKVFRYYSKRAVARGWEAQGYEKLSGNRTVRLSFKKAERFFTVNLAQIRRGTLVTIETLDRAK